MSELSVTAWHGHGKHRLYVADAAGVRVGWHDLTTGISRLEVAEAADAFTAAVAAALTAEPRLRLAYLSAGDGPLVPAQRGPADAENRADQHASSQLS